MIVEMKHKLLITAAPYQYKHIDRIARNSSHIILFAGTTIVEISRELVLSVVIVQCQYYYTYYSENSQGLLLAAAELVIQYIVIMNQFF